MKVGSREVGLELRARRVRFGLTLRRGAEVLGMTMTELSFIEQGKTMVTQMQFRRLCCVLRAARKDGLA